MLRRACALAVILLAIIPTAGAHADQTTDAQSLDTYVVQPGDTLTTIATRTGVAADTIMRLNNLGDEDTIFAGSVLRLRDTASTLQGPAAPIAPAARASQPNAASSAPSVTAASVPSQTAQVRAQMQAAGPGPSLYSAAIPLTVGRSPGAQATSPRPQGNMALASLSVPNGGGSLPSVAPRGADPASLIPGGATGPVPMAVQIATQYLGAPYEYGGSDPSGFDCSGFVYYVEGRAGRSLPRDISGQYDAGSHPQSLQPGDLVFFQDTWDLGLSHVGIYIGGGQFIHALDESRGVVISGINEDYYASHWYGSTRLP